MKNSRPPTIRRHALRIEQDPKHPLFVFTLTAEELLKVASVAHVSRDSTDSLTGYQRPEVRRHVRDIQAYLDAGRSLFPNSIILALSSETGFTPMGKPTDHDPWVTPGMIELPIPQIGEVAPAWIVDGQQRTLALSRCKHRDMPVPVNAFIADDMQVQRDQFVRINSTKPLPRGLVLELLPEMSSELPSHLAPRRIPSVLCDRLNRDPHSPFYRLIRQASGGSLRKGSAVVHGPTLIKSIEESLTNFTGCLFSYRNVATGDADIEGAYRLLLLYWTGVKNHFPDAWGLPPRSSRLMHSAGMRAMGRLMDRVMVNVDPRDESSATIVWKALARIRPLCRWTEGHWDALGLDWDELQNVSAHVKALSDLLLQTHLGRGRGRQ